MPDDWRRFHAQSILGESLAGQGKSEAAETELLAGWEGLTARAQKISRDVRTKRLRDAGQRLLNLYEAWERPAEADKWRQKVESLQPLASQ